MTELDLRSSPWNDGLAIRSEYLSHELYLLACVVNASSSFDAIENGSLAELRRQFQESEIGRLLIIVASAVRNAMDQNPGRAAYWLEGLEGEVGRLAREGRDGGALSFREACNKIIHCLSLNFDYVSERPRRGMAIVPFVHLYGTKGNESWKATIDINRFVQVAYQLT